MNKAVATVLVVLLLSPSAMQARDGKKQLYRWADLEGRIRGRKIAFVLPDGTYVKGKVLGIETDSLRLDVSESSNSSVQPKGKQLISAQSVSVLQVMETGKKWRIICTLVLPFIVVGAIAGVAGDLPESGASGEGAVAGGVLASFAGGYFLGWALDRKTTEIEIIRD